MSEKTKQDIQKPKTLWAEMRVQRFSTLKVNGGIPLVSPPEGPQWFIAVFDTKEQAVEFAGGSENVVSLEVSA